MSETREKMHYPSLETERLYLKLLDLSNTEEVFHHFANAEMVKHMDIPPCKDLNEAQEIIEFHMNDTGCRWGVYSKETNELIGTCGYHCWYQAQGKVEIGYDLAPSKWGQGYMIESLQPVIPFAFEQMGVSMIDATVDPANERSISLLEKLGFERADELQDNLYYYFLKLEKWNASKGGAIT